MQMIEVFVALLVIATLVAVLVKHIRLPYTVALVIVGLTLSLMKDSLDLRLVDVSLSQELILLIFLPPLLFEGTINMDLEILKRNALPVGLLALIGTALATVMMGYSLYASFGIGIVGALLLGSMLAPTDPVSVLAIFKEAGVDKDLGTIVEGESVFNDGIGVVLFLIFLQLNTNPEDVTLGHCLVQFIQEVGIGAVIGVVLGYLTHRIMGQIDDRFTEVMLSIALAYGSYVVALEMHASGVIAVVAAGLIIGNYGKILSMSPTTRITLTNLWEVGAFIVNSILFLLMGMAVDARVIHQDWPYILVAFVVMVLGRSLIVYGMFGLLNRFRKRMPFAWQHVINWGGLRGSIPIALVLGLPPTLALQTATGDVLTKQDVTQIIVGVVMLSLLLQGLTIDVLLRWLGIVHVSPFEVEYERLRGRTISLRAADRELMMLQEKGEVSPDIFRGIKKELDKELSRLNCSTMSLLSKHYRLHDSEFRKVANSLLYAQRAALAEAFHTGILSEHTLAHLSEDIDAKLFSEGNPFYTPEETDDIPDDPEAA